MTDTETQAIGTLCPRCGGDLARFTVSGKGDAACDACCIYWQISGAWERPALADHPRADVVLHLRDQCGWWSVAPTVPLFRTHPYPWELAWLPEDRSKPTIIIGGAPSRCACQVAVETGEAAVLLLRAADPQ